MIPDAEKVRARVQRLPLRLFGRHVVWRADQRAGLRHAGREHRARDAEVHHVGAAAFVQHDVLRLQVAMDHTFGVRSFQRSTDLGHDVGRFRGLEFFLPTKEALQVLALDVLHGDELDPVGLSEIKNANDVFMSDLAREDQFLLEAPQNFGIGRHVGANHFDGHLAVQLAIVRLVDGAHSALSQQPHDFIAAADRAAGAQLNYGSGRNDAIGGGHGPALPCRGQRLIAEGQRRGALCALHGRIGIFETALWANHRCHAPPA